MAAACVEEVVESASPERAASQPSLRVIEDGMLHFPEGFLWGCATSPTQVEGETVNEYAGYVARDGTLPDACNHWRRYRYDFKCLSAMNLGAYRLGFDWGRLQPGPGAPLDRDAMLRYMEMLAELRSYGIKPFLTLFHFACPQWMADQGGWLHPESPAWFADFAARLVEQTDGEVGHWITINEPMAYALMAYVKGALLPARWHRVDQALRVVDHLRAGHAAAYALIKERQPEAEVGFTKHVKQFQPARAWHPWDRFSTWIAKRWFDRGGLRGFVRHEERPVADFIGVNYYGRLRLRRFHGVTPLCGFTPHELEAQGADCDDMWEQAPRELPPVLRDITRRHRLPIYLTENGVATENERRRGQWLKEHLVHCHDALGYGVDLRGYFYWSLLDNFEWCEGLSKRFGLLAVDFNDPNRRRDLRRTGCIYGEIAKRNALRVAE